jgi:multiple sugar transport system ATP-binding protein
MAEISLKHVCKVYPGGIAAVSDCNLTISDKEFAVLVGPSGCGKTTILRMIAGLEDISSGELYMGDNRINQTPPKDRDVAMVFQNYALYPHKTVYDNMAFSLGLRKTPRAEIERRVREAARVLDIEHLLLRKPGALSGGQRQRVALGRAIVRHPAVFLLDEPLSNLDAKLRTSMRIELSKLHRRLGTTFVYVTHDQTEAMTMGDRIVVMDKGIVQQVDTPQKVYDAPCNVFVAGFIGSPRMNLMDVVLNADGEGYFLEINGGKVYIPRAKTGDALQPYIGRTVRLGVRPEDIYDTPAFIAAHAGSTFCAAIDVRELMGSEVHLYMKYGGFEIIARAAPSTASKVGHTVRLAIDMDKIHLFDIESTRAILH